VTSFELFDVFAAGTVCAETVPHFRMDSIASVIMTFEIIFILHLVNIASEYLNREDRIHPREWGDSLTDAYTTIIQMEPPVSSSLRPGLIRRTCKPFGF